MRSQRLLSIDFSRSARCKLTFLAASAKFVGEPGLGRSPISQNRCLRDFQKLSGFGNVKTAEKAAFHHHGLTRIHLRELLESCIKRDQFPSGSRLFVERVVECDGDIGPSAALIGVSPARSFDEQLAHRASCNSLEMQAGRSRKARRFRELEPCFIDEGGGAKGYARITAFNC